jgi:tRNA(fMet)-specific endonuclease VapC
MIAFDADVLTEILSGRAAFVQRASQIAVNEQSVPVIVVEEILRGRLNSIRRSESAKSKTSLTRAYDLLEETVIAFGQVTILPFSSAAEGLCLEWRRQKLRLGTHDLRIAAICVARAATLVTRNQRDFERVPGLSLENWT